MNITEHIATTTWLRFYYVAEKGHDDEFFWRVIAMTQRPLEGLRRSITAGVKI